MADQLYLSYWLRGFNGSNMLRRYEKMLRLFPFSRLARQGSVLKIVPIAYREPALFERAFPQPVDIAEMLAAAKDFQHDDCCYRAETWWDLWEYERDWQLAPARVALCCFGPDFERDLGEDLRIEFGIDTPFLPQPDPAPENRMIESNVKSLLKLVHDLDDGLAAERRQLWSETGENFAQKLEETLRRS